MNKFRKAIRFFRMYGFRAFFLRIYAEILRLRPNPNQIEEMDRVHNIHNIIQRRFITLTPLHGFTTSGAPQLRINLVTDSINSGSLFGGVATSFILSSLLSRHWNCGLRIITRTESPHKINFDQILKPNGIPFPSKVDFEFADFLDRKSEISVGTGDFFLTTSWWTTWSVRETFSSQKIIYLMQEDERSFYPYGDDHLRCSELMHDPGIFFVINTQMLYNHLVSEGFENLLHRGIWFEPAWPEHIFYYDQAPDRNPKNFFFYARPNNIRNLYYRGLEVIEGAVTRGILDPQAWNFHFAGKDIPEIKIFGQKINIHQGLSWSDYAALIRKMDLGLSLMYTPHPSYPPIDLAASGAVVVTNRFGPKQDLQQYSKNILCKNLDTESLIEGLQEGVLLACDNPKRLLNYTSQHISRDWSKSFDSVLGYIEKCRFNV